jgi:hypothetical protein
MKNIILFVLLLTCFTVKAAEYTSEGIQHSFESRYQTYLVPSSQNALPFDKLETAAWKALQAGGGLKLIFSKPDVFYIGKTYVFALYQAGDGQYYLHAKGGFWGMEELAWGPIKPELLQ